MILKNTIRRKLMVMSAAVILLCSLSALAGRADGRAIAETHAVVGTIALNSAAAPASVAAPESAIAPDSVATPDNNADDLYTLDDAGAYDLFTNKVDGYSLHVPKSMSVDMTYSSVRAVLESDDTRIEIYKEDVSGVGKATYIIYSNRFLRNQIDHRLLYRRAQIFKGRLVTATAFTRDTLAKIENDKNYYLCLDIPISKYVYTILIKSSHAIGGFNEYAYIPRSFSVFTPKTSARDRQSKTIDVSKRGWNSATKAFYDKYFNADAPLTWGIYEPSSNWLDFKRIKTHEETFGYVFPVMLQYTDFNPWYGAPAISVRLQSASEQGKTVELTLQTNPKEDGGNMVYDILNGKYDEFLRDYARAVARFEKPVLFRLGNEMNGEWCAYCAHHTARDTEIYKAFYRYVYSFFQEAGADNVIWVWNPNGVSFPGFKWNHELMYYPGDEYVDIVGMTAYNTGTYYYASGERWIEFDALYDGLYAAYLARYSQPFMITEFSCSSIGGDKEAWVAKMFERIKLYDKIKIAVWWDGRDFDARGNVSRSYIIEDTPEMTRLFRYYLSGAGR